MRGLRPDVSALSMVMLHSCPMDSFDCDDNDDGDDGCGLPFPDLIQDYDALPPGGCIYGNAPMLLWHVIKYPLLLVFALVVLFVYVPIFVDPQMRDAGQEVADAITAYHRANQAWPANLSDAEPYLPAGASWPVNPYNGRRIADTGSLEFVQETCAGMVYYEPVLADGEQVGYKLHVFGNNRRLMTLQGP
jgi:hypothetical protein